MRKQEAWHRPWSRRTIAGDAPAASKTLAMMSMDTKLVMHCTSGLTSRSLATAWAVPSAVSGVAIFAVLSGGSQQSFNEMSRLQILKK